MRRIALAAAVILAAVTNLWAQGGGQLPAWNVLGNPSAAASNARSASLNALFNGAFCSTNSNIIGRTAGVWGCLTQTQLTALINPATSALSGALPAFPGNTTTFLRGDGTYSTLNCGALSNSVASCSTDATNAGNISSGSLATARLPAFTGDTTTSAGSAVTVTGKINGTSIPTNAAADQILLTTAAATGSWASVPNCPAGVAYATASHTFNCVTPTLSFDTVALATAATIPATGTATIYIRGALTAGDVGAGFWTRSAGNPGHTAFFNSADGAFWSPSLANASFPIEMFGGKCDSGVTNNTTAFNKVLSFINIVSTIKLTFAPCFYYGFTTQPNASTGIPLIMTGSGPNSTTLGRNFNAALFNFTGTGGNIIKDMQICSISPATTGNLLNFNATASAGSNENRLDNLTVADCTGTHDDSLSFDGSAKITGAVGVRDNFLSNIFTKRVVLTDVVGFQWFGGLAINGSGVSFAVTSTASFNPNSIDIALSTSSGVSTVGATDVRIMAQSFGGNSTFDVNSNFVWLIGRTNTITVTNNCGTPANCGAFAH